MTKWTMTEALRRRLVEDIYKEIQKSSDTTEFDTWMAVVEVCKRHEVYNPWTVAGELLNAAASSREGDNEHLLNHIAGRALVGLAYELQRMRQERQALTNALDTLAEPLRGRDKRG